MSADQETVTADQPSTFPRTRAEALASWAEFRPRVAAYADARNGVRPGHRAVSRLSPAIRRRLVTEYELIGSTLAEYPFARVEKFVQEMCWRRYWKSWLELRPGVWTRYQEAVRRLRGELRGYQARRVAEIEEGRSGVEIMDYFADELRTTGYLHNHARMWFAGFWVHTEKLPWELGADFFLPPPARRRPGGEHALLALGGRPPNPGQKLPYPALEPGTRYVDPDLLAAHSGGLEKLEDKFAQEARVQDTDFTREELPSDADDTTLPDDLPEQVGVWVHADDLNLESATPLEALRPAGVFGGLDSNILAAEGVSPGRRDYLQVALRDGLARAGTHFEAATQSEDGPLPETLTAHARAQGWRAVVALRPAVGPLQDLVPAIRASLARENVTLHLVWRPEDSQTLPYAKAGYFSFWQGMREELLGVAGGGREDSSGGRSSGKGQRGKHSNRRKH